MHIQGHDEYLLEWQQYPAWEASWQPEAHLNTALKSSYQHPSDPGDDLMKVHAAALYTGVLKKLKSSSRMPVTVPFQHDVFRYELLKTKHWTLIVHIK